MKNTLLTLSISSFLFSLTACGSSEQSGEAPRSSSSMSSAVSNTMASSQSGANNLVSPLDGVWFRDCFAEDEFDPETFYDSVELTFNSGQVATNIHVYTDSRCSQPMSLAPNPKGKGTFSIGASFTSGDGVTVWEIDVHLTEVNGAPFDEYSYNIFYIDGDQLYMAEDVETPEERPTMLDFSGAFVKQ